MGFTPGAGAGDGGQRIRRAGEQDRGERGMAKTLTLEHEEHLSLITLNRPERRNAISMELMDELPAALDACAEHWSRRSAGAPGGDQEQDGREGGQAQGAGGASSAAGGGAVAITGAGSAFCAGMDIEMLREMGRLGPAHALTDAQKMARLFQRLYEFPLPTIAAVNGPAVAGGCGLASVCDFTLAAPEAKFGYTEARIGFLPALVATYLLRQIGEKRARDLLLTGRLIGAAEAHAWGLVTEVVAAADLLPRTRQLAADLARNSPASLRATKQLLQDLPVYSRPEALAMAAKANAAMRTTEDYREGLAAFLEKRPPRWAPH